MQLRIPGECACSMTTGERDRLVGLIYDGVTNDAAWSLALAQVGRFIGAVGVGVGVRDKKTLEFRSFGAVGIGPHLNQAYQRLASDKRIWEEIGRRRQPLTDRMVRPKAALIRTELDADPLRPQDFYTVMAFPTPFKDAASPVVVAFRSWTLGDFKPANIARFGLFAGHFGRAIDIHLDREAAAADLAAAERALNAFGDAILLLDRAFQIQYANAAARTMLDAGHAIRLQKGRLEIQDPEANMQMARIVAQGRGGELRLAGPGVKGLTMHIDPRLDGLDGAGDDVMLVRIANPNREREPLTPARLRERLGLAPRQAEVVAALAAGLTEAEAAHSLKVAEPTLHTHVRRVYERLDMRNRAELMALLDRQGFHIPRK
jgi:DNA-binding CsgD family transcriptional regulator